MVKISVIIPVKQVDDNLHRSINSVLRQSYSHLEIFIAYSDNDGILYDLSLKYSDKRIIYIKGSTIKSAISQSLMRSTGEYLTIVHSGDIMHSEKMRIQLKRLVKDSDITVCSSWIRPLSNKLINIDNHMYERYINSPAILLLKGNFIPRSTALIKRSFLTAHNITPLYEYIGNIEYRLLFDIIRNGGVIYIEPQYLAYLLEPVNSNNNKGDISDKFDEYGQIKQDILDYMINNINSNEKAILIGLLESLNKVESARLISQRMVLDIFYTIFSKYDQWN